jgi:hypothetical protein
MASLPVPSATRAEAGRGIELHPVARRGRDHQRIDQKRDPRALGHEPGARHVVHPVLVRRNEQVGRRARLDLPGQRRGRGKREHRMGMPLAAQRSAAALIDS